MLYCWSDTKKHTKSIYMVKINTTDLCCLAQYTPLTRNLIRPLSVPFLFHSQAGLTAIWWEWSRDCFHVPSMLVIVVVYCCLNNVGKCYFFLHVFICCWWKTLLLFLFALKCTKHPTDSSLFPINSSLNSHPMGNREPYMVNTAPTAPTAQQPQLKPTEYPQYPICKGD